ncbi:lipase/acyltransferase domain-containing protein [Kitasatospora sp. NPDC054939]
MPLKHLVVVVPGIGGSVLRTPGGARRWDEHRRRLLGALTRPDRLGLDESPELDPVDVLPDITVAGPFVVPGYGRLVRRIVDRFGDVRIDTARPGRPPDLGADVLLFPYDFRLSVEHAARRLGAEITARLRGEHAGARQRRVIIVAHSMGGLVARYWLGPGGGAEYCKALITLGTPHRGAPKALDVLANGLPVGPVRLAGLTRVIRSWPSVYELLPRYPALARPGGADPLYPYQWDADPVFAERATAAFKVHQEIETAWTDLAGEPQRPRLTAVFSRGHGTFQEARLTPEGVAVTKEAAPWLPNPTWHGDGTVPAISAIPIDAGNDLNARRVSTQRHLALASAAVVVDLLTEHESDSLTAVRGDVPDRPWLGLDLDEAAPAGVPVPLRVTLNGASADERTRVRIRHRPAGDRTASPTPWREASQDPDGSSWHALLDPLPAGPHHLEVAATGVPRADRLTTGDTLAVIATDPVEWGE